MEFLAQFKAARRVSTPLLAVRTFDALSTLNGIKSLFTKATMPPVIQWDCITGFSPKSDTGGKLLNQALADSGTQQELTASLPDALRVCMAMDEDAIILLLNTHLFWSEPSVIQSVWNLRDRFKTQGNMLVMLCASGSILPAELTNDVLVLDEPLPSVSVLETVIKDTFEYAKFPVPDAEVLRLGCDALIGLPLFPAEQSTAMCLDTATDSATKGKLDIDGLWTRKRQTINQTRGLSITSGKEKLEEVGGLENFKQFMHQLLTGRDAPKCIIFSDEIEKAFAGTGTDSSGTKTELTGHMLSWTTENDMPGVLALGVPGAGKTQIAKALAAHYGIPFITFNLAAMQDSLVGNSGMYLRAATATVDAVSSGKALWLATCNSIGALPPELRARFKDGTFFFDAPDAQERASIWAIHRAKFEVPEADITPEDEGWTGREIRECCSKAYRMRLSLSESSKYIVPVTVSSAGIIDALREQSTGKYLSASEPGIYAYKGHPSAIPVHSTQVETVQGRKMRDN
jgi:hypothetical protein